MFQCRGLGEGSLGSEIGNAHGLFQRQAGRHDLPKQAGHLFVTEWPLITLHHGPQHLGFALRTVKYRLLLALRALFNMPNLLGTARSLADQLLDFSINLINSLAQFGKRAGLIAHSAVSLANRSAFRIAS